VGFGFEGRAGGWIGGGDGGIAILVVSGWNGCWGSMEEPECVLSVDEMAEVARRS
jgi:hypothetical protein